VECLPITTEAINFVNDENSKVPFAERTGHKSQIRRRFVTGKGKVLVLGLIDEIKDSFGV